MTRPETLEAALAWLAKYFGEIQFMDRVLWCADGAKRKSGIVPINGDIPAAIVEAVGQVWDQVSGKDGAE